MLSESTPSSGETCNEIKTESSADASHLPLPQEMERHVLERVSQQIELASKDSPDVEDVPAADLECRSSRAIIVAESATVAGY
jgi:hypothetical protein